MSITDKLQTLKNTKQAIKQALINKGVEISDTDDFASYADKIENIEPNGTGGSNTVAGLDITDFVNIDNNGKLHRTDKNTLVCNASDIGDRCFYHIYNNNDTLTSISFPNVTTISGSMALQQSFYNCKTLASINFPNLKSISGLQGMNSAFSMSADSSTSPSLTSIAFPELETITGYKAMSSAFENCKNITSVFFPKLTTISGSDYGMSDIFNGCSGLTSISFPNLTTVDVYQGMANAFKNCSNLESVNFPTLSNLSGSQVMYSCFSGCSKLTTLDLPNLEGDIYNGTFAYNNTLTKIWIPKEVTTIKATSSLTSTSYSYNYSPFRNCSPNLIIYTDAPERLEGWSDYCFHIDSTNEATIIYGATHEDFEKETLPSSYPTLTINIPDGATINGTYNNKIVTSNIIKMMPNSSITLDIVLDDYYPLTKTYTIEDINLTVTIDISEFTPIPSSLDLHYDYSGQEDILSTFVDDVNYKIDNTKSAITSISKANDEKKGYYGYIIIKPTIDVKLHITCRYQNISNSYSAGCHSIYIGSKIYQPTNTQIYNNTKDGNGEYLERGYASGYCKNGSTDMWSGGNQNHTVSTVLNAGTIYYINFASTKSAPTNSSGTFIISNITTTVVE